MKIPKTAVGMGFIILIVILFSVIAYQRQPVALANYPIAQLQGDLSKERSATIILDQRTSSANYWWDSRREKLAFVKNTLTYQGQKLSKVPLRSESLQSLGKHWDHFTFSLEQGTNLIVDVEIQ